jgi:hypothetical protein
VVAVVVCFILSRAAANAPAPAHGQPFWVRLVLSALAGALAWLLLWLFCQLLVLWFCVLAGLVVAVIVFVVRRTGWVWRLVVSLLAGGATFAILWLLLRDRV